MKAGVENSRICVKMWCNEGWYKLNDDTFLYMSTNEFLQKKMFLSGPSNVSTLRLVQFISVSFHFEN
jgi:hypothetical protein